MPARCAECIFSARRMPRSSSCAACKGAIYDVIVDMREGRRRILRWFGAELSEDNGLTMYVPKGFRARLSGA